MQAEYRAAKFLETGVCRRRSTGGRQHREIRQREHHSDSARSAIGDLEQWKHGTKRFTELRKRGVGTDLAAKNGGQRPRSVAVGE